MMKPRSNRWANRDSLSCQSVSYENQHDHQKDNSIEQKPMSRHRSGDNWQDLEPRPSNQPSPLTFPAYGLAPQSILVKQPITQPITEAQLINEVKGIYAGLAMVERKCVDIFNQQNASNKRLSDQQWRALVALHRTLLREHHDFFSASQHPTASENLKKLGIKYLMPARMWRHGLHAFMELLRYRLPDYMEHMLNFVYLSYSMMALLKENVSESEETWIECLGDFARYRTAIERADHRDGDVWSNVAKLWYNEASDESTGRIKHHLAVLARPDLLEQLFYYSKALAAAVPFINTRESVMLLFDMCLTEKEDVRSERSSTESAFEYYYAMLFTRQRSAVISVTPNLLRAIFNAQDHADARLNVPELKLTSALFPNYGDLREASSNSRDLHTQQLEDATRESWPASSACPTNSEFTTQGFDTSESVVSVVSALILDSIRLVASRMGDKNILPFIHVVLASMWKASFVPGALAYIKSHIPWASLVSFLNTTGRPGVSYAEIVVDNFPRSHGEHGKQLPEDFVMRGQTSTGHCYPTDFFVGSLVDEDERPISVPNIKKRATVVLDQSARKSADFDLLHSKFRRWSRSFGKALSLMWFISMIPSAGALPIEVVGKMAKSDTPPSANNTVWTVLLYAICAILTVIIPILGPKITVKNATYVSSLVAFMSAMAMSVNSGQDFPYLWGAFCAGVSLGSSLWLLRTTKADQKSILIAIARYLVPAAAIWRLLSNSDLSGHDRELDLSNSIPCLSAFGTVFVNALINEQIQAICGGLRHLWEKILAWLELAPINS